MGPYEFDPSSGNLPPAFEAVVLGGTGEYSRAEGTVLITPVAGRTASLEGNIAKTHVYDLRGGGGGGSGGRRSRGGRG